MTTFFLFVATFQLGAWLVFPDRFVRSEVWALIALDVALAALANSDRREKEGK